MQRWLGHHSPAFTLSVYIHLLDGDLGDPLPLPELNRPPGEHSQDEGVTGLLEALPR